MAKTKNKKPALSEKVRKKKLQGEKPVNPFEIKFNRTKHDVLGRRVEKHNRGMPGISRLKAHKKRKETLLVEYKSKTKVNKFVDRRIGENDPELSVEDKMLQRFAKERQKHHDKSSVFNLNEDEQLTHYGQSLAEIEKFDDPVISDDDEEQDKIDSKIVSSEHFGGFLTKANDRNTDTKHQTWKEKMEEIIAKSKKDKHERQSEREKTIQLTQKVDSDWKELRQLMGAIKNTRAQSEDKNEADEFDKTVNELKFETKGMPTDRLKTEEELAKEEKERLEKLEADRLQRMRGLTDDEQRYTNAVYRSADDLDDGLSLGKGPKFEVTYKEGKMVGGEESASEDSDENEEQEQEADDNADQEEEAEEDAEEGEEEEEEEEEEGDDSDSDAMEHTSDLESDEDEEDEEEEEDIKESEKEVKADGEKKKKVAFAEDVIVGPKDFKDLLKSRKTIMEAARKELPYTFKAPETYVDLLNLFGDHTEDEQIVIIKRLRKCHHPSLAEGNKTKLEKLFTLLVELFGDLAIQDLPCLDLMNRLLKHIYELCQMSPLPAGLHMVSLLKEKQNYLTQYAESHGGRGVFPTLDVLLQLKLISQLFPTSDFHHHVTTPAMLFMSQTITQCPINTRRDIASGLFICSLILEYTSFSKRFTPEVINFLGGILFLAIKKDPKKLEPVMHPFKPIGRNINFLELQNPKEAKNLEVKMFKLTDVFSRKRAQYLSTDDFKVNAISQCVHLLQSFSTLYADLPSYTEIFSPIKYFLSKLPTDSYPQALQDAVEMLQTAVCEKEDAVRPHLVMQSHKPKPMVMYEPKVDDRIDGRKKFGGSKEFAEKQRSLIKFKKEMKGAQREIRKDTQFLARQKLHEKMEKDAERKRKVKEIYSQLANQEGDYKRLKREKDRV